MRWEYDADAHDEMVMNGSDTNFDGDNEVYAVNNRAFAYGVGRTNGRGGWQAGETKRPIQVDRTEPQRVCLVNTTECDPINPFHTHSRFFDKCLRTDRRPPSDSETTTEAVQTMTTASTSEVAA